LKVDSFDFSVTFSIGLAAKRNVRTAKISECSLLIGWGAHVPQPNYERNSKTLLDKSFRVCKSERGPVHVGNESFWSFPRPMRAQMLPYGITHIAQLSPLEHKQKHWIGAENRRIKNVHTTRHS
jgi:hypothetical protein